MDDLLKEVQDRYSHFLTRRHFLKQCGMGMGAMAMGSLAACSTSQVPDPLRKLGPHFAPKAKTIIYLHMAGAPSQLELFDYKPTLYNFDGKPCPDEFIEGKRFAFIVGRPELMAPQATFKQYGESGSWVSNHLPHFTEVVDDVLFLKGMHTDQFNHAPAQLFMHTGSALAGRPSFGSWITYGLGSENNDLPGFVVLVSGNSQPSAGKSLWGSGFLPSVHQGVQLRSKGDPVLYLNNPKGVSSDMRKSAIDTIGEINRIEYEEIGDPEILTRVSQYELAYRMQMTVPEAMDISKEPDSVHEAYGTEPGETAFSNNCLLARRLAERGVRFIQLYHRGWDSHGTNEFEALEGGFVERCKEIDKPMTALVKDLKERGMLDDVLLVWGGEFGRTPMRENRDGKSWPYHGRDHHSEAFTMWMTGGGIKTGMTYGETDEMGYTGIKDRIHVHDLQATMLHQMGLDHELLTHRFQGRDFRLTDVHGHVVKDILS